MWTPFCRVIDSLPITSNACWAANHARPKERIWNVSQLLLSFALVSVGELTSKQPVTTESCVPLPLMSVLNQKRDQIQFVIESMCLSIKRSLCEPLIYRSVILSTRFLRINRYQFASMGSGWQSQLIQIQIQMAQMIYIKPSKVRDAHAIIDRESQHTPTSTQSKHVRQTATDVYVPP